MARKKHRGESVAEYRERMADSMARVETGLENVVSVLTQHTIADSDNFKALHSKEEELRKLVNRGIGGLVAAQILVGIAIALFVK